MQRPHSAMFVNDCSFTPRGWGKSGMRGERRRMAGTPRIPRCFDTLGTIQRPRYCSGDGRPPVPSPRHPSEPPLPRCVSRGFLFSGNVVVRSISERRAWQLGIARRRRTPLGSAEYQPCGPPPAQNFLIRVVLLSPGPLWPGLFAAYGIGNCVMRITSPR
jgi:hypothetical protein